MNKETLEIVKSEIERRIAALKICGADKTEGYAVEISGLQRLLHFINSLPQEEANTVWHDASEKPKPDGELTKEWCEKKMILVYHSTNNVLIHKAYEYLNLKHVIKWAYIDDLLNIHKQKEVSEDLELASERYACKFSNSKYGHDKVKDAVVWGANWQKEQMIAKAVDGEVGYWNIRGLSINMELPSKLEEGDKVKLIIIKED